MTAHRIESTSPEATEAIGLAIGRQLGPGAFIALSGPLGAGKTCLVQGMARGLDCGDRARSPSYTLINEYPGRTTLFHCDWYRLDSDDDIASTGFEDLLTGEHVIVVEWAEKGKDWLPDGRWNIAIACEEDGRRILTIQTPAGASFAEPRPATSS